MATYKYFLGCNAPDGPYNLFDGFVDIENTDNYYILKGGPGTGKSSFMRAVSGACSAAGLDSEEILCPSDPASLDGLLIPGLKTAFADGTPPHTIEPPLPGALGQMINTGAYWNVGALKERRDEIEFLSARGAALHEKARGFIKAASSVLNSSALAAEERLLSEKIERTASQLFKREIGGEKNKKGSERLRYLSAVTPDGFLTLWETVEAGFGTVFCLEDEWWAGGDFMRCLRELCLSNGRDITVCMNPLSPREKIDHILLNEIGVAFVTSHPLAPYPSKPYRNIRLNRFMSEPLSKHKVRLSFNRRAARELLAEGCATLNYSRSVHNVLEQIYAANVDFEALSAFRDGFIAKLFEKLLPQIV